MLLRKRHDIEETSERQSEAEVAVSHRRRLFGADSYYALFVLLLVSLAFTVGAAEYDWGWRVGQALAAASLLLAVRASRASRVWVILGWIVFVGGLAGSVILAWLGNSALGVLVTMLAGLVFGMLLIAAFPLIIRRIAVARRVTGETIAAALSAYLLVGIDFAILYLVLSVAHGEAVVAPSASPDQSMAIGDLYYYSFVNMTTVGLGDFVPVTYPAKLLGLFQAIFGQIFLITIVARLVSLATFWQARPSSSHEGESGTEAE